VTRARERLCLTYAARRTIFGNTRFGRPSRFIDDIPRPVVHRVTTPAAAAEGSSRYVDRSPRFDRQGEDWSHPQSERAARWGGAGARAGAGSWTDSWKPPPSRPEPVRPPGERYIEREDGGSDAGGELGRGARVTHDKFGRGVVQRVDDGADPIVTVEFSAWGEKRIKARFLKLG
jgi:DNA helicase-2/ATP-dependent DNA helicase PcrA